MKISENLIAILKNFGSIGSGLLLKPGLRQSIISESDTIIAEIDFEEEVPGEFGVHDLSSFIPNLGLFKGGELVFDGDLAIIKSPNGFVMNYRGAAPQLIKYPKTVPELIDPEVAFDLKWDVLNQALSLANMNELENLSFVGSDGKLMIKVHNKDIKDSNFGTYVLGDTDKEFVSPFRRIDLRFLPVDYEVKLKIGQFGVFNNNNNRLIKYTVAEQF